jgi:putative endonuclease
VTNNKNPHLFAQQSGRLAETLAAWYLRLKGYRILARNFRHASGEIDIIAQKGALLVWVEVKQRHKGRASLDDVPAQQWARIGAAATAFVGRRKALQGLAWRFDFIGLGGGAWPRHLKGVWRF